MTSFEEEFREELRSHFGMREEDARQIAEQGARLVAETDCDDSSQDLVQRMDMDENIDPINRWNVVAGILYGGSWSVESEEGKNPYQIRDVSNGQPVGVQGKRCRMLYPGGNGRKRRVIRLIDIPVVRPGLARTAQESRCAVRKSFTSEPGSGFSPIPSDRNRWKVGVGRAKPTGNRFDYNNYIFFIMQIRSGSK